MCAITILKLVATKLRASGITGDSIRATNSSVLRRSCTFALMYDAEPIMGYEMRDVLRYNSISTELLGKKYLYIRFTIT